MLQSKGLTQSERRQLRLFIAHACGCEEEDFYSKPNYRYPDILVKRVYAYFCYLFDSVPGHSAADIKVSVIVFSQQRHHAKKYLEEGNISFKHSLYIELVRRVSVQLQSPETYLKFTPLPYGKLYSQLKRAENPTKPISIKYKYKTDHGFINSRGEIICLLD